MSKKPEYYHPIDDRQLMVAPGASYEPIRLVRSFGCYASMLLIFLSWVATAAVIAWQRWPLTWWPFVAVPAALWIGLLALPMFIKFRSAALTTLDALTKTSEAYLQRAGFSIDINSDGYIGHHTPVVKPPVEEYRPLIVNAGGNSRIIRDDQKALPAPVLADEAKGHVNGADLSPDPEPESEPVKVRLWHLPGGEKIEQGALEYFVDGVFVKGLARGQWVGPDRLTREQYDGCMALLQEAKLLEGRKPGHAGKLTVRNARQARMVLDLPAS